MFNAHVFRASINAAQLFVCTILCERLAFGGYIVTVHVNGWNLMV